MNYGLTAARNAPGKDHIQWSQDGKILYFDGRPLEIVRWKSFVYQCIEKLEDIVIRLMFITVLPDVDLYSVQDNPNNHIIGHYFALGSDDATTEARRRMLNRIVSLNMLVEWQSLDGSWNLEKTVEYERLVDEFLSVLIILINMTCGVAGRGVEMLSVRYCNARESDRNIFVEDGQV